MKKDKLDGKRINEILKKTLEAINDGKKEAFEIAEQARGECEIAKQRLEELKQKVSALIENVDQLEIEEKRKRSRLLVVSKNFQRYTEQDIKDAYEEANNVRLSLMLKRQEEKELIQRRSDLEVRLRNSLETLEKAQKFVTQVGVAMEYLTGDLDTIVEAFDHMDKKQYLGVKIIQAQEDERQRVARDIHDGPAQSMANVVLKADLCEKLLDIDREKVQAELTALKTIVRHSLKDIRKIIYDLRPMSLDDLGLVPTVQRYAYNFSEDTGMEVDVKVLDDKRDIDSLIQLSAFRIIQEALNNIRKHSHATRVTIRIEVTLRGLNVSILDNGDGFDLEETVEGESTMENGYGLIGMRERAELLNGKLTLKSTRRIGTKVTLKIPLNGKDDTHE